MQGDFFPAEASCEMREVDSRIERVGDKVVVVGDSFGDLRSAREVQSGYVFRLLCR